jgi:hypothetical protein
MKKVLVSKNFIIILFVLCLIIVDIVISKTKANGTDPIIDEIQYESGSDQVDGYTAASMKTHVSILKSDQAGLSFSKGANEELTTAEIREMVYTIIRMDHHYGTKIPELKYKINDLGSNAWIVLMSNFSYVVGDKYTPGDQEDPRVIWAVLDYVADSTNAKRISLLATGTYRTFAAEFDVFDNHEFNTVRWKDYFTDLPDSFTIRSIVDAAQARHPTKTIECINTNYNEIMQGGVPYNELSEAERAGKLPEIYPVPDKYSSGIGGLNTSNYLADNGYNPTDAVLNSDFLINIPVMKTTGDIDINCGFKNYIGSVSRGAYGEGVGYPYTRGSSLDQLDHGKLVKTVINLVSYHPADYTLIDGTNSMEGDGSHPWGWRTGYLKRNILIAGGDPVAVEAVACVSMGLNPNDMDVIRWAKAKGFGYSDLRKIHLIGTPLPDVQMDYQAPIGYPGTKGVTEFQSFDLYHYYGRGCRRWLMNGPYSASDLSVAHIDEANADPRPGDTVNGKTWTPYYSPGDVVDLTAALNRTTTNSIIYAFTQIYSETARSGLLYVGGIRDIKVIVNGTAVLDTAGILSFDKVNAIKNVSLNQGDNRILVKVRRSGSEYRFSLAVVNDGRLSARTTYMPYAKWPLIGLGEERQMSDEMKMAVFGGRTLMNTFYHLGQSDTTIGIEAQASLDKGSVRLSQNTPNPFNSRTRIDFYLPNGLKQAQLEVHDVAGRKIATLFSGHARPGSRTSVRWDGRDKNGKHVANGIYFYTLKTNTKILTRRLIYAR